MNIDRKVLFGARRILFTVVCLALLAGLFTPIQAAAQREEMERDENVEWNNQIRRDKFDMVLPEVMRKNDIDMWIHVMRIAIPDSFGAEEFGSTSGYFVFTDTGEDRIERAVLGRRWGATHREWGEASSLIEESGAYDIISDPIFVREPLTSPMTEYDFRFRGLKEFVAARDPKRIALNYMEDLGPWATYIDFGGTRDGISHTDYMLLTEEIGEKYASRLVSSEYVMMDYIIRRTPSEIELLKKLRAEEVERVKKRFASVVPGVTSRREAGTIFRRMYTGQSQRGRSDGWDNTTVQHGDILASPGTGLYAYVLHEGETKPPPDIQRLWENYLTIDKILAETIRSGRTSREIQAYYAKRFEEEGIILRADQLHMAIPKNDYPTYSAGYDSKKTHLSVDAHGMMKGARSRSNENLLAPRPSSYGPEWTKDIVLPDNYYFVLEYFFYMPSVGPEGKDQYLFWWDHESAITTEKGVEYLSPPQKELILIK